MRRRRGSGVAETVGEEQACLTHYSKRVVAAYGGNVIGGIYVEEGPQLPKHHRTEVFEFEGGSSMLGSHG